MTTHYRGYRLLPEDGGVGIYYGSDLIQVVADTAAATALIDAWLYAQ